MLKFKPSIRFERQVILKKLPSFACKSVSRVSPHCFTNPNFCLQTTWQRLVRRMTRFFTTVSADASLTALKDACECLTLGYKLACNKQVPLCLGLNVVWQLEVVECLKRPRLPPSLRWQWALWTDAITNSSSRFICWRWIKKCCWTSGCPRWVSAFSNSSAHISVFPGKTNLSKSLLVLYTV